MRRRRRRRRRRMQRHTSHTFHKTEEAEEPTSSVGKNMGGRKYYTNFKKKFVSSLNLTSDIALGIVEGKSIQNLFFRGKIIFVYMYTKPIK